MTDDVLHTQIQFEDKTWFHMACVDTPEAGMLTVSWIGKKKKITPRLYRRATSFDGGAWVTDLVGLELLDKHGEQVTVTAKAVGF